MTKVILNNFGGGIVNDPRKSNQDVARVVSNFDIVSKQSSLLPYRSSEDGNSNASNDLMQNWLIALRTGTTYSLYGLGRQTATAKVRIFIKELTTGAANDLDDNGWSETSNNTGSNTFTITTDGKCFVYYKKTGYIYGVHGGANIWRYDPTGSGAFVDAHQALTYTTVAQGIVHSQDDILYIPYDNKIASNNNGTWTIAALTLPSQYYITSICEFGAYIAIGCAALDGVSNSRVFIWDRSTTLATITENIDWGSGQLKVLEEISGFLVGISLDGGTSTTFKDRVVFRYYTGAGAIAFDYIEGSTGSILLQAKQKINNRIYFMMSFSLNGSTRDGVWSFGKNGNGFNLVHERTPNNDTSISTGPIRGFFYIGNYLFQAFINASSAHAVTKTDDQATYSHTSVLESQINPKMLLDDRPKLKQLKSISVGYTSSASGQVVVKYKVDGGSYTTVCTCTTTGVNVLEFKDAAGVPFTKGREYEFKIESTLGAEVTYLDYDYDFIPTLA